MNLRFTYLLLLCLPLQAQVGIGTTNPTAALDINGDLRIRNVTNEANPSIAEELANDSILVVSREGTVKRITSRQVHQSNIKTFIKGNFANATDTNLSLTLNYAIIPFDEETFDLNNEFDPSTHTFTAKQEGVYSVFVQINSNGVLAVSTNYGVCIFKNATIVAQQNFANIAVLGIKLTPPVRSVQTLVQLNEGDTIHFELFTNLLTANILSDKEDSFFTIHQIR